MPADSLYQLIKNLSPSEKRYFKIFVGTSHKKDINRHVELFEAIAKQKQYNEESLIKALNYQKNPNSFSSAKNYLFQLILKSLRNYHSNSTSYAHLMEMMRDLEILYNKKLYKPCQKIVQKLNKMCDEGNYYEYHLIGLGWEMRLAEHLYDLSTYWQVYESIIDKVEKVSAHLRANTAFLGLLKKVQIHNMTKGVGKRGEELETFTQLGQHPLLADYNNAITDRSKIYYHAFYVAYYGGLGDLEQQMVWNKKLMSLFEEEAFFRKRYLQHYIQSIAGYLFNLLELKKFAQFEAELPLLKNIEVPEVEHENDRQKEFEYLHLMSAFYIQTGEFQKVIEELVKPVESYFSKMSGVVHSKNEIRMLINIGFGYLSLGRAEDALTWVNRAESLIDKNVMVDMYIVLRSYALAIHFQLKNASLLDSCTKSLERYLLARNKMGTMEAFLIRFMKKSTLLFHDRTAQVELLKELKKNLNTIIRFDPTQTVFQVDRVLGWIESRLRNKTLAEIVEENRKRTNKVE